MRDRSGISIGLRVVGRIQIIRIRMKREAQQAESGMRGASLIWAFLGSPPEVQEPTNFVTQEARPRAQ